MWTEKKVFDPMENISDFGLLAFAAEFAWCENSRNLEKKLVKWAPSIVNRSNIIRPVWIPPLPPFPLAQAVVCRAVANPRPPWIL
ncbi:hypothetical protein Y032_0077g1101 [Ancylostoma ceylanicum]|uniref:Uncharacterized protein n=1 Tax=Ancylostoma ceylanicum TaxID=53326 RepID=A0A016TUD2_9BILA|nr:hypothetical protein Y032_0077g1101 [Ancylostoma ceylanicum]